ncbi:MAG: PaaI family thioesterase [Oscillospiraceae bacterium]|nr:PaaI family thioesterase [Oscillospiraceae bacterium]MDD3261185.1 PaaI family thioesterase [Oscillospiraceae bacterium]
MKNDDLSNDLSEFLRKDPFMEYNHIQVDVVGTQCTRLHADLVPESMNPHGISHGGLLYTLADCAAGITARADGRDYVTQNASMNFLRNVRSGSVFAKSTLLKRGRRVVVVHVEILDQGGTLLADAVVNMMQVTVPPEK